jgi:hypothetical protein
MNIQVECYAGYRGEETPRVMVFGTRRVAVKTIIDRWLAPDHRYFKCVGDDGGVYIIRNDVADSSWEVAFFNQDEHYPGPPDVGSGKA